VAEHVDVLVPERKQTGHIFVPDLEPLLAARSLQTGRLTRAHPLAAIVDERPIAEKTGQRPPPDPALRLQYQDIHAGGCQQPRRIQA
jgi:hypothetical protein